ncbi:MAG: hypothetical protein OHK0046_03150 [Anaerolineae bacterium]
MKRTPPERVKTKLRKEVGFRCPIPGCGSPYLEFHHFDPSFSVKKHHNVEGMIALCPEHHRQADGGAFTVSQLRRFKAEALQNCISVAGKFQWMRNDLLITGGTNVFYQSQIVLAVDNQPLIWFDRDSEGNLLLNVKVDRIASEPVLEIHNNSWLKRGEPIDLVCPPSGRSIHVRYQTGFSMSFAFSELQNVSDLHGSFLDLRDSDTIRWVETWKELVTFPVTRLHFGLVVPNYFSVTDQGIVTTRTNMIAQRVFNMDNIVAFHFSTRKRTDEH